MYDSIIRVQYVKERLRDDYHPVQFSDIPEKEQQLLHPVIEEGGYQTCDVPPEFSDLVARLMENARKQQNDHLAYIEYRDTYYGLYIERADEVYSY